MQVALRGLGVVNPDGTISVTVDPNAGDITLPSSSVLSPMTGDPVAERYANLLTTSWTAQLAAQPTPGTSTGSGTVMAIALVALVFALMGMAK